MHYQWNYEPPTPERQQAANELAEKIGMSPIVADLLIGRGIKTESAAKRFFRPMMNELIDPFLMNDMDVAVDRLNDAMGRKERIMVYGDYDVDGCTAVALVYKFLQQFYSNIEYYIPNREEEGYGVSVKGIDYAKDAGVKLIIVLDCGITAIEEIAYAKQQGSIAADLVPVTGENRIMAFHGLKLLTQSASIGLKAIIDICGLTGREINMSDIVFKIGPRINASGRMQNGKEAVELLVERDLQKALTLANRINEYNEQRKDVDKQMTEEANEIVARLESQQHMQSIVLYDEGWKKGVVGIVASRLTELYFRPTVVLTIIDGMASGSARSVAGFDIYDAIKSCRDLLENFGGHTYAVGLTLRQENIPEFRRRFQEYVSCHILPEQTLPTLEIDKEIDFKDISKRLHSDLRKLAPHGPENPKPLFLTRNVFDYGTSKVVGRHQEHIKLELVDSKSAVVMNGIAFGQSSEARYIKSKRSFDIVYTIEENAYKRGEVQLQIEDIRPSADNG